jgi:TctA family transporter
MDALWHAFGLVFEPYTLLVICLSSAFGLFVGATPGLTATMATSLLVPVTFFMAPVPAVAAIVTASAMAIFSGDIPGALLRIPGTPASAAYVDESYKMTLKGQADLTLGAGLVFSAMGGIFGTIVLVVAAPALAELSLQFSSFEYFWLVCLGLTCAVFITSDAPVKGLAALFLGLFVASVGLENPAGVPRFTFDVPELLGGVDLIPAMIGIFAISEVMRVVVTVGQPLEIPRTHIGNIFSGQGRLIRRYWRQFLRGSTLGTLIGALPGAGADIAAWISYAMSKRLSKEPEKFGTGHVEGVIEAGAANNSAVSGAWIPALVFGIPGDSITAIVIGVLYLKGLNPGPTIFIERPAEMYAVLTIFFLANIAMLPFGWAAIKSAKQLLRVPRNVLMPIIMIFCVVGAFAVTNSIYGVVIMFAFGIIGFVMEENGFPIAPLILGIVLGPMLEQNFVTSMIKAGGDFSAFFGRPIAAGLGVFTILVWLAPLVMLWRRRRQAAGA